MEFLKPSKQEEDLVIERECFLCKAYYEAHKDDDVIFISDYKQNIPNSIDFNVLANYQDKLKDLGDRRRDKMFDEMIKELKVIESLNYHFYSTDKKLLLSLNASRFGCSRFPAMDGTEPFYVYDLSDYNCHLKFKYQCKLLSEDRIICLSEKNSFNEDAIEKITKALNRIIYMLRNFEYSK